MPLSLLVAAGLLTPQSRGSAAAGAALDPRPGAHVLDLCAGPGIKTGQIAERMGDRGEVISVESDPERAAEVAEQARRLGLRSVTDAVGSRIELPDGAVAIPLPHPSGASSWLNLPENRERVAAAAALVHDELARLDLAGQRTKSG